MEHIMINYELRIKNYELKIDNDSSLRFALFGMTDRWGIWVTRRAVLSVRIFVPARPSIHFFLKTECHSEKSEESPIKLDLRL